MHINCFNFSKILISSTILAILNLIVNSSLAQAEVNRKEDLSLIKISTFEPSTKRTLKLHSILTNSLQFQTKTIDPQPNNLELSKIEQIISSESQLLIANSFRGKASWYGPGFHGRLTANGERYNQNAMTAAHRYLKFGTKVRVKNLNNGRSIVVRINDRGPFIRGRVIDLSMAAASSLNMINAGVAPVEITVLGQ